MKIFTYVFGGIGLLLLAISGFLVYNHQRFMGSALKGHGEVIRLEYHRSSNGSGGTYYPVVRYTTQDGKEIEFTSSSGSNPASYEEGEKVNVMYNPKNPQEVSLPDFFSQWGAALIVGFIGAVFGSVGFGFGFYELKRKKDIQWLNMFGTPVQADYKGVKLNTSLTVNGRNPYRIHCQWIDNKTNTLYVFESDDIWFDPSGYIPSDKLKVLIDTQNPKRYYLDISFLPKKG
jgi:hypothetical protein